MARNNSVPSLGSTGDDFNYGRPNHAVSGTREGVHACPTATAVASLCRAPPLVYTRTSGRIAGPSMRPVLYRPTMPAARFDGYLYLQAAFDGERRRDLTHIHVQVTHDRMIHIIRRYAACCSLAVKNSADRTAVRVRSQSSQSVKPSLERCKHMMQTPGEHLDHLCLENSLVFARWNAN